MFRMFPQFTIPTVKLSPHRISFQDVEKIIGTGFTAAVPLGDLVAVKEQIAASKSIHPSAIGFLNHIPSHANLLVSTRDSMKTEAHVFSVDNSGCIQIESVGKRVKVSPKEAAELALALKAKIFIAPAEELPADGSAGNRREKRAAESAQKFAQEGLETFMAHQPKADHPVMIGTIPSLKSSTHKTAFIRKLSETSSGLYLTGLESLESALAEISEVR